MLQSSPLSNMLAALLLLLFSACTVTHCAVSLPLPASSVSTQLYVIPQAEHSGGGSFQPLQHLVYSSLQAALDGVELMRSLHQLQPEQAVTISLHPSRHFVSDIRLTSAHSQVRITSMTQHDQQRFSSLLNPQRRHHRQQQQQQQPAMASISGGLAITNWTKAGPNLFTAVVPSHVTVTQLFVNDRRVVRSRVPVNQSEYLQYAAPLNDTDQARYGFQYVAGQFDYPELSDAMVVVYHSWTTSHHYIDRLFTENNTVRFTNPSQRPIGSFGVQGQQRFHIENLPEALAPNTFCFVRATRTVMLMTDGSYDLSTAEIIAPLHERVLTVASADAAQPVRDVVVDNVVIEHSAWRIGRTEQADSQAASFLTTAPLYIANASNVVVSAVTVQHTGSYGVWLREGATDIELFNLMVTDTGAGGIRLGQMEAAPAFPTTGVNVMGCEVSYGGNVFPSGVAVISHRAVDVSISGNHIHHHRYSGMSIGWQWGYDESYTRNVVVSNNYIHDIGRHILCDQGGIYTLGIQRGSVISGNVIKNVFSYAIFMWGIYLDEGTSDVLVTDNVVYNTGWSGLFQHYGANNSIINNVFARASLLPPPQPGDDQPDGMVRVNLHEPHTSWSFSRNIVYDTSTAANRSAYMAEQGTIAPFDRNVYFNPNPSTRLLFGPNQTAFANWQKTGQDVHSVVADPLFAGDVKQCDFFTVRADSPAAKLGFVNITRLPQWTPGCEFEDDSDVSHGFYQW